VDREPTLGLACQRRGPGDWQTASMPRFADSELRIKRKYKWIDSTNQIAVKRLS
jgi:hypothetical protein